MQAKFDAARTQPEEGYIDVGGARLFYRATGQGHPVVVVHGGPDFDHAYLLPDLDRLADPLRLIYYDQRGRGKSADHVEPGAVSMASEVADLDAVRVHFGLETVAILGHSWGGLLALEYALRHPQRVSHLILLNTAPASRDDFLRMRQQRFENQAGDLAKMKALASTAEYRAGDPDRVADYYRIHFSSTLRARGDLEQIVARLRSSFTRETILNSRLIEDRLRDQTWLSSDYDLLPALAGLTMPALVIHGEYDLVPREAAQHIAAALPRGRFVLLPDTGHFAFLEAPDEVRREVLSLFEGA